MSLTTEMPTPEEFVEAAASAKVQLIERLSGMMISAGYDLAQAAFEFYVLDATKKGTPEWASARARRAKLDLEYDALKHGISALQSTLRAERVGILEQ